MATNVVASVVSLCTASLKSSHPQHGAVMTPAKWAELAGFPGSKASGLRDHMARSSANGCGRSGRYAAQDARGMLDLLARADEYKAAESKQKQEVARRKVRQALDKNRAASVKGAGQAKGSAKRTSRKAKAPAKAA